MIHFMCDRSRAWGSLNSTTLSESRHTWIPLLELAPPNEANCAWRVWGGEEVQWVSVRQRQGYRVAVLPGSFRTSFDAKVMLWWPSAALRKGHGLFPLGVEYL
jgi:hypothetical protein